MRNIAAELSLEQQRPANFTFVKMASFPFPFGKIFLLLNLLQKT
jgi:hypothetical protein